MSAKWQKLGISALVSPAYPCCAPKAVNADDMGLFGEYLFIWNVLSYPSGIVPVTKIQPNEQEFSDKWNDKWTDLMRQTLKGSEGMPIGVQVVAHSYEDEKALAIMHALDG